MSRKDANNGIFSGDTVLSINDREIHFSNYCDFFVHRKELLDGHETITLKISRKGIAKNFILLKEKCFDF